MKSIWIFILISLSAVLLSCSRCDLQVVPGVDTPWIGSEEQAVERSCSYFSCFMDSVATTDTRWGTERSDGQHLYKYNDKIVSYLKRKRLLQSWPESNFNYNGYQQRLAPFKFYIVSVEPLVIIMIPYDFGEIKNRGRACLVGDRPSQFIANKYMVNYFEYGTYVPFHENPLWFSPDLKIGPIPVPKKERGDLVIEHRKIELVFKKQGGIYEVIRLK
ncbi:hypothetical protein LZ24_03403 [Desulfobotulus alkaliphilus]|jgi:hypothetical protein|uniref:Lipoprotein n=1 Tax=Desulfobotulus alkaliphilus TaxID=622671 RepID=A0A562R019_9BACT|nr:hypothetical protein [Desulfobotulus alkaliphilus]TWI61924.1 hypothetical protein LZ24_03403 [Desulfobotulus alkaliphilus]